MNGNEIFGTFFNFLMASVIVTILFAIFIITMSTPDLEQTLQPTETPNSFLLWEK